jgi:cobalt-zinc-cadmium efflux system membrane fusion protein
MILFWCGIVAHAHDGHDHGDTPAPVAVSIAPRFEARSELFELVGVLRGAELVLYLDRAADNAPVPQATIEIESGAFKGQAQAASDGTFRLAADALAQPGQHALTITVESGTEVDLLNARFGHAPQAVTASAPTIVPVAGYGAAALLLGLALAWSFFKRKPA